MAASCRKFALDVIRDCLAENKTNREIADVLKRYEITIEDLVGVVCDLLGKE